MDIYRRSRKWCVAILLVLLAAGCHPAVPHQNVWATVDTDYKGHGPKVVVLGDSITNSVHDRLHTAFAGRSARIVSALGEGLTGGPWTSTDPVPMMVIQADILAATTTGSTGVVAVVALGTNDAWNPRLTSDPVAALDLILDSFAGACTVGVEVTLGAGIVGYNGVKAAAINAELVARADVVVDWRERALPGDIEADGIHLTPVGQVSYAAAVGAAVANCV